MLNRNEMGVHHHSTRNLMSVPGYGSIQCFRYGFTRSITLVNLPRTSRPLPAGVLGCAAHSVPNGGPIDNPNVSHNGRNILPAIGTSASNTCISGRIISACNCAPHAAPSPGTSLKNQAYPLGNLGACALPEATCPIRGFASFGRHPASNFSTKAVNRFRNRFARLCKISNNGTADGLRLPANPTTRNRVPIIPAKASESERNKGPSDKFIPAICQEIAADARKTNVN